VALTLALGDKWKVRATAKLIGELQRLWGSEQVILHAQDPVLLGRQERGYSRAG
jgi:hypothetical protein